LKWSEDEDMLNMFRKAGDESDIERENDKKRLFELMSKNINKWWD
jgi:hypothetical protein